MTTHPAGVGETVVAIAQDLRETANAALHSTPTWFWIDALLNRVRALGHEELAQTVALAERDLQALSVNARGA